MTVPWLSRPPEVRSDCASWRSKSPSAMARSKASWSFVATAFPLPPRSSAYLSYHLGHHGRPGRHCHRYVRTRGRADVGWSPKRTRPRREAVLSGGTRRVHAFPTDVNAVHRVGLRSAGHWGNERASASADDGAIPGGVARRAWADDHRAVVLCRRGH